jgi:L-amino acid N-acyltransferase YncA
VRFAEPTDSARIAENFGPYVLNTAVTFAVLPPNAEDFTSRISGALPFLVLEHEGEVVAFVFASAHRALFALLREQYAVITLPNAASASLYERFGFRFFARFESTGFKLGEWRDVGWWELSLLPKMPAPPPKIIPIAAVREKRSASVQVILSESPGDIR